MWQLIPYYYSDNYVVFWLASWFHGWPHISYDGFKIHDSTFDPEDQIYIETLIFWAGLPVVWLIITLGVLFVYCCCQCCKRQDRRYRQGIQRQLKKSRIYQWLLISLTLLCTGVIGVGFYGNEGIASGLQHFTSAADQANETIKTTENQVSTLNTALGSNLTLQVKILQNVFQEPIANETIQEDLQELSEALSGYVQSAATNMNSINTKVENNSLDVGYFAAELENYEYFRWVGVVVILCLQLIICLLALCGAGRLSKPILAGVSVLSTFLIIIVWMIVGAELFVTIGASDLCVSPNEFLIKEAQRNSRLSEDLLAYYIDCDQSYTSPFKKSLTQAVKDLALSDSKLDEIKRQADGYYPEAKPLIKLIDGMLEGAQSDLQTVTASLDCTTLHQDYTTALYSVCYDSLTGVSLLLASSVAAGLLLSILIFLAANLVKNIVKRKIDYEVDQEDPFLPPNNPTLERFRRNDDVSRPYRRPDSSPGPRLSYQGSVQGYCSDNDARPQGPLGSPAGYTAGARSSFVDDSPLMTSGFESPPPSYTLAMSRDNQNNSRTNRPSQGSAPPRSLVAPQNSGASLV